MGASLPALTGRCRLHGIELLMAGALAIAFAVSTPFLAFLLLYVVATTAYSFVLKTYMLLARFIAIDFV